MARMIPSQISPEVKSTAERRVFEWFANAPGTDDWIVLHSLGISNHKKVMYGEIDFFVIAPSMGIFALEVKGGRVQRLNGTWIFKDKYNRTTYKKRGPFEQANEGICSLIAALKAKCGEENMALSNVLYGFGVMFPDFPYIVDGTDGEQWQVFNENDGTNVRNFVCRLAKRTREKWEKLYESAENKLPSQEQVLGIADWLRGDFDVAVSNYTQIKYSEQKLLKLTEEQLMCLEQLEDEPRCIIEGAAGTGKTLLAIEAVKRAVAEGKRVALICYNTLLGKGLSSYCASMPKELRPQFVGSFHSLMLTAVHSQYPNIQPPSDEQLLPDFYQLYLPNITVQTIRGEMLFDCIIVDESQDLICDTYLDIFDAFLKGGLASGQWIMFGDFNNQAIFTEYGNPALQKKCLKDRASCITYKLLINCRNTKPIGTEIHRISGLECPRYLLADVDGLPVNHITYQNNMNQKEKLEGLLTELLAQKIAPDQIAVLSPRRKEHSVVSMLKKYPISAYNAEKQDGLSFSTIQAFKGLESPVVILTDITSFENSRLLYVGLSRARSMLCILETEQAQTEYVDLWMR